MFEYLKLLWRHTLLYAFGHGFAQAANFILLPLFARYISVEEFGIFALIIVFAAVFSLITELGIRIALTRIYFDFDEPRDKKTLFGTTFLMLHITSIALLLLLIPLSNLLSSLLLDSAQYAYLIILVMLSIYFENLFYFHLGLLRIKNRPKHFVAHCFSKLCFLLLLTPLFLVVLGRGLEGIFEARLLASFLNFIMSNALLLPNLTFRFNKHMAREIISFGLPFVPTNILSFILTASDRYLLRIFKNLNQVGLYSMGYRIGMSLDFLVAQPFNLAWPQQIKPISESVDANQIFSKVLTYYVIAAGFIVSVIIIYLDEIYGLFLTPNFASSKPVAAIVAISYLINGTYNILLIGIFLSKKTKYQPMIYGTAAILNVLLNLYFIPLYGMYGAAVTTLISYSIIPIMTFIYSRKYYLLRIEYLRILKGLCSLGAIIIIGHTIHFSSCLLTVFIKFLLGISFPLFLVVTSFYDDQEILKIRELCKKCRLPFSFLRHLT